LARPDVSVFREALDRYFGGAMDKGTLERLGYP
jgi:uncharacterized protein (DUF1810 family)